MTKRPNSRVNLDKAIERNFGSYRSSTEIRSIMAGAIVGQLLEGGVVKGGCSLKLRYGVRQTRATMDLDTACAGEIESFISGLGKRLKEGWNGFTGEVIRRNPATPKNVPEQYVMKPYAVRLMYGGQSWCTVSLEVGFNEIGDADDADFALSDEVCEIFTTLGFPIPGKVPLMPCEHQVAQKLHGLTSPGSRRVHDLIDIQLILEHSEIDLSKTRGICIRLFAFRRMQTWPPKVLSGIDWEPVYEASRGKTGIMRTLDEAIVWANDLIARIDAAR